MANYNNLVEMQEDACRNRYSDLPLYGAKGADGWNWVTYGEFGTMVDELRGGLAALGVDHADKVAIISRNSVKWAACAYATYGRAAHFTAMYEDQLPKDWKYIIADSGTKVLFVNGDDIYEKTRNFPAEIESLEHVINLEGDAADDNSYDGLRRMGRDKPVESRHPETNEPMGLIYTSGTTGNPKGVILSHGNILSNINSIQELIDLDESVRSLSFLPWAHIFGQVGELHSLFVTGASAAFAEDIPKIVANLGEIQPTVLFAVPRIFNKIYEGVNANIKAKGGAAEKMFRTGMQLAQRKNNGETLGLVDGIKLKLIDKVVFSKIRDRFGGRLRYAVSGAAALNEDVAHFMANLGIEVYEGYGLSETSPMVTVNSPKKGARIGTVGKVIPNVTVKLDTSVSAGNSEDGEIIVYGPNVMQGYHNRPDATAEVMTPDGGFKTGDLGRFDGDGFLKITGRIKEQYKLENGKYVVPAPIEEKLQISEYIDQVLLYGDNRLYNVAVIVPNEEVLKQWATDQGITDTWDALLKNPAVIALFEQEVEAHGEGIKGYELPKKVALVSEPWTPENGMLTPTMKLKRPVVLKSLDSVIDTLYG